MTPKNRLKFFRIMSRINVGLMIWNLVIAIAAHFFAPQNMHEPLGMAAVYAISWFLCQDAIGKIRSTYKLNDKGDPDGNT